jgi:hypothetical protein
MNKYRFSWHGMPGTFLASSAQDALRKVRDMYPTGVQTWSDDDIFRNMKVQIGEYWLPAQYNPEESRAAKEQQTFRFMWGDATPGEPFKANDGADATRKFLCRLASGTLRGLNAETLCKRFEVFESGTWQRMNWAPVLS